MSDLISRQAAIDELDKGAWGVEWDKTLAKTMIESLPSAQPDDRMLHESCTDCPLYDKDRHSCPRFNKVIPVTLRELQSAQQEQRWIPCSERQPDKGDDYLVTLWDDGRTWVEIALWNETFGGRWQAVLYNDVDYSDISNVIAWMPLPEPYRPEGSRNENKT